MWVINKLFILYKFHKNYCNLLTLDVHKPVIHFYKISVLSVTFRYSFFRCS